MSIGVPVGFRRGEKCDLKERASDRKRRRKKKGLSDMQYKSKRRRSISSERKKKAERKTEVPQSMWGPVDVKTGRVEAELGLYHAEGCACLIQTRSANRPGLRNANDRF